MREMKDSGVAWIGEIPATWSLIRFKDKYRNIKEIAGESVEQYERLALTLNGVIRRPKEDDKGLQPKEFSGYQILRENDFIFKMIDLQNISTSRVGLSPYTGLVSPAYIRFTPKHHNTYTLFTYYFLMSMYYNCVFNSLGGDGVRSALNASDMGALMIPFPKENIQKKIAEYISEGVKKVDALITNQEQQIEKLKAYKQSLITEVVTKGLNPDAPMKDSGVEWIGDIPEHWIMAKLSHYSSRIGDGLHGTPIFSEGDYYFINGNNLGNTIIDIKFNTKTVGEDEYQKHKIGLTERTLLISLNGTIGSVTRYKNEKVILGKSAGYICLKDNYDIDYLRYYLQSYSTITVFELSMAGTTIKNLSLETLRGLKVPYMSLVEQKAIADYLDEKCSSINRLIEIKQQKIEKLNDYKKSLIYEYVTGKKEVV